MSTLLLMRRSLFTILVAVGLLASACGTSDDAAVATAESAAPVEAAADTGTPVQAAAATAPPVEPAAADEPATTDEAQEPAVLATSISGDSFELVRAGEDTLLWFWAPW